jgi:hypothetical protein
VKISLILLLVAAFIALLFAWIFPVIDAGFTDSPVVGS